jgi:N,N'-diacetyllegionaminate synthase
MDGPDHKASLDPTELKQMVSAIRNIEKALGSKYKTVCAEEIEMRKVSRRSIVANRSIKKGEVFTEDNLAVKKPGTGISSKYLDLILGRVAAKNIQQDELIMWDGIGEMGNE